MNTLQLKEILPFAPSQMIEHTRFPNSLLGNVFDKQIHCTSRKKQAEALQILEPAKQKIISIIFPKKKHNNLI